MFSLWALYPQVTKFYESLNSNPEHVPLLPTYTMPPEDAVTSPTTGMSSAINGTLAGVPLYVKSLLFIAVIGILVILLFALGSLVFIAVQVLQFLGPAIVAILNWFVQHGPDVLRAIGSAIVFVYHWIAGVIDWLRSLLEEKLTTEEILTFQN